MRERKKRGCGHEEEEAARGVVVVVVLVVVIVVVVGGEGGAERREERESGSAGSRDREGQRSRVVRHSPDLRPYPLPDCLETPCRPLPSVPRARRLYSAVDSSARLLPRTRERESRRSGKIRRRKSARTRLSEGRVSSRSSQNFRTCTRESAPRRTIPVVWCSFVS